MMEKLDTKILGSHIRYPNDGYRALCAAVLLQAWNDAYRVKYENIGKNSRLSVTGQARAFLTGNYSRGMLKFYCEALGINPNYIIKLAMKNHWSKGYEPKYFKEHEDERKIDV